jgi:hypothetical protein
MTFASPTSMANGAQNSGEGKKSSPVCQTLNRNKSSIKSAPYNKERGFWPVK